MPTKWKIYLPLITGIIFFAAVSAFAISSVIPGRDNARPTTRIIVSSDNADNPSSKSEIIVRPSRITYSKSESNIDPEELNRRLIAEGLAPIISIQPSKPVPIITPPPPVQDPPPVPEPVIEPDIPPTEPPPSQPVKPALIPQRETIEIPVEKAPDIYINASHNHNPEPPYPKAAERKGIEGTVTLKVKVGMDGSPLSVEIKLSSGHSILDKAAVNAVRDTWRFNPASLNGHAVESWVEVPIIFTLD